MVHSALALPSPGFWVAAVQIVWVNLLLSGDNAVVIAVACRALPRRERFWAMAIGAGFASVLLIVLTSIASVLLELKYVQLAGGIALLWIASRLLAPTKHDSEGSPEAAQDLRRAVKIVVLADLVMSLDNVLAVAALAKSHSALLIVGLAVSIPIVIGGSAVILWALQRLPILVWGGAAILGWVAGSMLVTDPAVAPFRPPHHTPDLVELGAGLLGVVLVLATGTLRREAWRRRHKAPQASR
jgi:YjbE family integral membrane protein